MTAINEPWRTDAENGFPLDIHDAAGHLVARCYDAAHAERIVAAVNAASERILADEWIEWNGGECPVLADSLVDIRVECGNHSYGSCADDWDWTHGDPYGYDIVAYRLAKVSE
jgi:hypothetical protein